MNVWLTDWETGLATLVDRDVAEWLEGKSVRVRVGDRGLAYAYVNGRELHRWVLNPSPGMDVDHRNRDTLDNRTANLREATRTQNLQNRRGWGKHGKGVRYKKARPGKSPECYEARITVNGKRIHLGTRSTPEEAHALYAEAALKYFGEFACVSVV